MSGWTELWKTEDYWAIWIGLALILAALLIYLSQPPEGMKSKIDAANAAMKAEFEAAPFKTVAWYDAQAVKAGIKASSEPHGQTITRFLGKTHGWSSNPLDGFLIGEEQAASKKSAGDKIYMEKKEKADALKTDALAEEDAARKAGFSDEGLNGAA
jgi:hypothetical protein